MCFNSSCSVESFTLAVGVQAFGGYANFNSVFYTITSTLTNMWFVINRVSWMAVIVGVIFCALSAAVTAGLLLPVAK